MYFLSLSLFPFPRVERARARLLWSLSSALLCFLLSSHRNDAKELRELKWKIKKYCGARDGVHSQRCPFVHQKSLKHRKATFCSEKIFPEILRGQCSPHYIRLRVQKNPFDSHPHKRALQQIHRQTDRSLLETSDRGPFSFSAREWTVTDRPLNNDVNIINGRERFQIRLRDTKKFLPSFPGVSKSAAKGKDIIGK